MTDIVERLRDQVAREVPNPHSLAAASLTEIERLRAEVAEWEKFSDMTYAQGRKWMDRAEKAEAEIAAHHAEANRNLAKMVDQKMRAEKAEAALSMIAAQRWSMPPIDSDASMAYSQIVSEMQRTAMETLAQKEPKE